MARYQAHRDDNFTIEYKFLPEVAAVRNCKKEFIHDIDVMALLPYLPLLSQVDVQCIKATHRSSGDIVASDELLDRLVRKPDFWGPLLSALRHDSMKLPGCADILEAGLEKYKKETSESTAEADTVGVDMGRLHIKKPSFASSLSAITLSHKDIEKQSRVKYEQVSIPEERATPRSYQVELAFAAESGENCIICAPTGSGKTMVATLITNSHYSAAMAHKSAAKILFLVHRVPLVTQVARVFCEQLPTLKTGMRYGTGITNQPLDAIVASNDITVATADSLKNALFNKSMQLSDVTLIFFDECHNGMKNHPYNQVMRQYIETKMHGAQRLPQVVGLSASPTPGKKVQVHQVCTNILTLCANMDAQKFVTVKENREELESHVNTPSRHFQLVRYTVNDNKLARLLSNTIMEHMEGLLEQKYTNRGTQEYESFIVELKKQIAGLKNTTGGERKICDHLIVYNNAIRLVLAVRMSDGLKHLEDFYHAMRERQQHAQLDEAEEYSLQLFDAYHTEMTRLAAEDDHNPKLLDLRKKILQLVEECRTRDKTVRGIVFVRTKVVAHAMLSWMMSDEDLQQLKPTILTGVHAGTEAGGQSLAQQQKNIDLFACGDCKLLVSTSVGEEGLDIAACNMVVKYDHLSSVVSMIQGDGRARQEDSTQFVIGDANMAQKNELNLLLEETLEQGINIIQELEQGEFQRCVQKQQREEVLLYQADMERSEQRGTEHQAKDISLKCYGCEQEVCTLDQVRRLNHAYIIPDEMFQDKICLSDHPEAMARDHNVQKVHCKKCDWGWGRTIDRFPCLSMNKRKKGGAKQAFRIFINGSEQIGISKWSDVPCTIAEYKREISS